MLVQPRELGFFSFPSSGLDFPRRGFSPLLLIPPSSSSPSPLPCCRASCVTLLMTLRKHAVSTSSEPARARLHKPVNRADPLPCQPLIIIRQKKMKKKKRVKRKDGNANSLFLALCSRPCNKTKKKGFFSSCLDLLSITYTDKSETLITASR